MQLSYKFEGAESESVHEDGYTLGRTHEHSIGVSGVKRKEAHLWLESVKRSHLLSITKLRGNLITGHGSTPHLECGQFSSAYHLLGAPWKSEGTIKPMLKSCHRQSCPRCASSWNARAAKDATANLALKAAITRSYLHHDVISWTMDHYNEAKATAEQYNYDKEKVNPLQNIVSIFLGQHTEAYTEPTKRKNPWDVLAARLECLLNFLHKGGNHLGYAYVHHPGHLTCIKCGAAYKKNNSDILDSEGAGCDCHVGFEWTFHPHTHVVSNSYTVISERRSQEALDGDVYKNIGKQIIGPKKHSIENVTHLYNLLKYEMSHALYRPGKHVINYVGAFANINFNVNKDTIFSEDTAWAKLFTKQSGGCLKICMKDDIHPLYALDHDTRAMVYLPTSVVKYSIVKRRHHVPIKYGGFWKCAKCGAKARYENGTWTPICSHQDKILPSDNVYYYWVDPVVLHLYSKYVEHLTPKVKTSTLQATLDNYCPTPCQYYIYKGIPVTLTKTGKVPIRSLRKIDEQMSASRKGTPA